MLALDAGVPASASRCCYSANQSEEQEMASTERPLSEAIRERRATPSFEPTAIPEDDLRQILRAGLEAPSGYNLQPWRFVMVRDPEQRKRLQAAAMGQPKVGEAPVVIVACGDAKGWSNHFDEIFEEGNRRGIGSKEGNEKVKQMLQGFLGGTPGDAAGLAPDYGVWLNRHTMIAFTTMMWMAECLGYDTAPMEGFVESQVRQVLAIPDHVRVVALLAIGKRKGPDKPHGGRLPSLKTVFADTWGNGLSF
jgi:nitroreductase